MVYLRKFSTRSAYNDYFAGQRSHVDGTGRCRSGEEGSSRWNHNGDERGPLVCIRLSNGDYRIAWGFDDDKVAVSKEGASLSSLYSWWEDHANLLTS
ncbi:MULTISPECIES: hypothetical protein [unclassified Frankia]